MENFYTTKIIKSGNSLAIVLPRDILAALQWGRGDHVVFGLTGNTHLVLRQLAPDEIRKLKPTREIAF